MTPKEIKKLIRRKTGTTTDTYPDSDILTDVNTYIEDIASRIKTRRQSIWHLPATTDLNEDQREYALPVDKLSSIVTVEVKPKSANDNYVRATALKQVPDHTLEEDTIRDEYANDSPYYFFRRDALFLLCDKIEDVEDGLRIVYNAFPDKISDIDSETDLSQDPNSTSHGFPGEFHELLARRVSIAYKDIHMLEKNDEDANFWEELDMKIGEYSTVDDSLEEIANIPSGASLGDNGYNY